MQEPSVRSWRLRLTALLLFALVLGLLLWSHTLSGDLRPGGSGKDAAAVVRIGAGDSAGTAFQYAEVEASARLEVDVPASVAMTTGAVARVLGPDGEWFDGCDVAVIPSGRIFARGTTSGGGWFRTETFPTSPAIVEARSGRLLGQAVWEPELATGAETSHVVVHLRNAGSIFGSVVHGVDRRPMPRARVMALRRGVLPPSLDRVHRAGYTVETVADDLGHFELVGLAPDAEYVLHAALDGHVSAAAGVVVTARAQGSGVIDVGWCEVEVLPALGALVQFVDGGTGAVLPASFSQIARMHVSGSSGEALLPYGVVLDELDLTESTFLGREPHGLRAFVYRVATTSVESASIVLTVESPDHMKVEAEIPLVLIGPQMEVETVVLNSFVGPLHAVTLRLSGYPTDRAYRFPGTDQVHLEHADGRGRSQFVVPDRRGEVHLTLPEGTHRLRFEGGGGWLSLPEGEAGTYKVFEVVGPTVVELEWPPEPVGVLLDLRDSAGNPKWDFCMVYWTRAEKGSELAPLEGLRFRTLLFAGGPYWVPHWTPGHYHLWVDKLGVGLGYRIEVPAVGGPGGTPPRVRVDLTPLPSVGPRSTPSGG